MPQSDRVLRFWRAYRHAPEPIPGDKSALGLNPLSAFKYCEAVRTASALGWYVFPPKDVSLLFDGRETFVADSGRWRTFVAEPFEPDFHADWDGAAPDRLAGHAPNFLTRLGEQGIIQLWTGWFVETAPGWSLLVRPLVNAHLVSSFWCFEAVVETDSFRPLPLFVNLKICRTDAEIFIERDMPLFQVQAIERTTLAGQGAAFASIADRPAGAGFDWDGLLQTLRIPGVTAPRKAPGAYGARVRRSARAAERP